MNRITSYTDANGNIILYNYDQAGNLITLIYPGGKQVSYTYDAANRLTGVTDWAGRVTTYEYDVNNRLVRSAPPNGTVETRTYDAAGQLTQLKDVNSVGTVISQFDFTYDLAGNVISETSLVPEQSFTPADVAMTYTSDNRIAAYNGQNVTYDADGNMTSGPLAGIIDAFTYDPRNRLTGAGNTTYGYDAENHRISVTETISGTPSITSYVVNPNSKLSQVLIQNNPDGTQTFYVYGLGLIGQEETGGAYKTYHFDRRGSTVALTDQYGTVTDSFQYTPYGELVYREGETVTPFLYNGRYGVMTDNNGLNYMRARYYNTVIKRFVNQDVVLGSVDNIQSLNLYSYAKGNPVMLIDPTGNVPWAVVSGAVGALYSVGSQVVSDVIDGKASSLQIYVSEVAGGFAGGVVAGTTGNILAAAATYASVKNSTEQTLNYFTDKEKFDLEGAGESFLVDTLTTAIGGKVAQKLVKVNPLHTHKWANKVIKNLKTQVFGKHAEKELWQRGIVAESIYFGLDEAIKAIK